MKTLICTVGLPRSGKSTWSMKQGVPVVNPDSIRLALYNQAWIGSAESMIWTIAEYMVKSLFITGHKTVILDATNLTDKTRFRWLIPEWTIRFKLFKASKKTCIQRAKKDSRLDLIPVIEMMADHIDYPTTMLYKKKALA